MATAPTWFDEEYYLSQKLAALQAADAETYGDWTVENVEAAFESAGMTAYDHYVQFGDDEGLSPNPLFDYDYYLDQKAFSLSANLLPSTSHWSPDLL
jgi:hypothetical protein